MLMMPLMMLAAVQGMADWDGLPVPAAANAAVNRYSECLMTPLMPMMDGSGPSSKAGKVALVRKGLATCRSVRAAAVTEAQTRLAAVPNWTDPSARRAKVARMFDAAEERVAFGVLDRADVDALFRQQRAAPRR